MALTLTIRAYLAWEEKKKEGRMRAVAKRAEPKPEQTAAEKEAAHQRFLDKVCPPRGPY
jgi:hypothetical protein